MKDLPGWVSVSGGISSSPNLCLFIDARWQEIKSANRGCDLPLAFIDSHQLKIGRIYEVAKSKDPPLAAILVKYCLNPIKEGEGREVNFRNIIEKVSSMSDEISSTFSREDVEMLLKNGIIKRARNGWALGDFKVEKKGGVDSRFITNCKIVNEEVDDELEMQLPLLEDFLFWGSMYPVVISVDASSYFFQFALRQEAKSLFPMRFKYWDSRTGAFQHVAAELNRLPMGFKLAPAIAQRTSNLISNWVNSWIKSQEHLEGVVTVWVDNFLVFAKDMQQAERIMKKLQQGLVDFGIKVKAVDYSQCVLGMKLSDKGFRLDEKFREGTASLVRDVLEKKMVSLKEAQVLFGKLNWANTTVVRRPLAIMPATRSSQEASGWRGSGCVQ